MADTDIFFMEKIKGKYGIYVDGKKRKCYNKNINWESMRQRLLFPEPEERKK